MKITATLDYPNIPAGQPRILNLLVSLLAPPAPENAKRPPINVLPVVDVSGSMAGRKLLAAIDALEKLAVHLGPGDRVGLLTFDTEVKLLMPLTELTEAVRERFLKLARGLKEGSSTNLGGALIDARAAVRAAMLPPEARTRLIALTDGRANAGPVEGSQALLALARDRSEGISLSAFGYGRDCDQMLLGEMAAAGGGSYAFIENRQSVLAAFAQELGGLMATYASDLRVELVTPAGTLHAQAADDLLHHAELKRLIALPVPALAEGARYPLEVRVAWRGGDGRQHLTTAELSVRAVQPGAEDRHAAPEVARAVDERTVAEAQEEAERLAMQGLFEQAGGVLRAAAGKLNDRVLAIFLEQSVLPAYATNERYQGSSGHRSSVRTALRGRKQVAATDELSQVFAGTKPTPAEKAMMRKFREEEKEEE